MAWWEEHCVFSVTNPFVDAIVWYGRYIDDLLVVWRSDQQFLQYLNSNDCNLSFTEHWDPFTINFLDVTLMGNTTTSKVETSLFRKPTAGNTLLRADSCHTSHTVAAVPYGEFIRARRACSSDSSFESEKEVIKKRLTSRGYHPKLLSKAETRIHSVTQLDLLKHSNPNKIKRKTT